MRTERIRVYKSKYGTGWIARSAPENWAWHATWESAMRTADAMKQRRPW